jgi:DNA-directed RNA polymerase specialized sigma24 family protein
VLAFTTVDDMDAPDAGLPPPALLGTDRLGRPFTDAERDAFGRQLRAGGFHEARAYGKLFAWRLARSEAGAEDLVQRACLRLVRWGWDPAEVPLRARLVRLVWSEWTHEKRERKTRRGAEEGFLRELQATAPAIHVRKNPGEFATVNVGPSVQDQAERIQEELDEDRAAEAQLEKLRARFEKAGDTVNLLWLGYTREGISDLQEMATRSARDVGQFYDAAKRRKRHVARLAAESNGVTYAEDEKAESPS